MSDMQKGHHLRLFEITTASERSVTFENSPLYYVCLSECQKMPTLYIHNVFFHMINILMKLSLSHLFNISLLSICALKYWGFFYSFSKKIRKFLKRHWCCVLSHAFSKEISVFRSPKYALSSRKSKFSWRNQ